MRDRTVTPAPLRDHPAGQAGNSLGWFGRLRMTPRGRSSLESPRTLPSEEMKDRASAGEVLLQRDTHRSGGSSALAQPALRQSSRAMFRTVVVVITVLGGCSSESSDRVSRPPAPPPQVTGEDVTVRGTVTDAPARHVVIVGRADREPLVVILRQPTGPVVGTVLEVTGRVRTFRVAELEAELGTDLEPAVDRFEGGSCLVVSDVPAPRSAPLTKSGLRSR